MIADNFLDIRSADEKEIVTHRKNDSITHYILDKEDKQLLRILTKRFINNPYDNDLGRRLDINGV